MALCGDVDEIREARLGDGSQSEYNQFLVLGESEMKSDYHGGVVARKWRRRLSTFATAMNKSTHTYKFPLEGSDGLDFDSARHDYGITEGIGKGSLLALLCAVPLCGFRLFSKIDEASAFVNRDRFPDEAFENVFRDQYSDWLPALAPSQTYVFIKTKPRKNKEWEPLVLSDRLCMHWTSKRVASCKQDAIADLAMRLANFMTKKWTSLDGMCDDPDAALGEVGKFFQTQNANFPSLTGLAPEQTVNGVLAYDPNLSALNLGEFPEEFVLHATVSALSSMCADDGGKVDGKRIGDVLCSSQTNGMSWLFGSGLRFFATTELADLQQQYRVPDDKLWQLTQLKEFFDAIHTPEFLELKTYADLRRSVSGKATSWISNYWSRLDTLKKFFDSEVELQISPRLYDEQVSVFFSGSNIDPGGMAQVNGIIANLFVQARETLPGLLGTAPFDSHSVLRVERITADLISIAGEINLLNNRIEQEIEKAKTEDSPVLSVKELEDLRVEGGSVLDSLPKINRISGGVPPVDQEISSLISQFNDLRNSRTHYFNHLQRLVVGEWKVAIANTQKRSALKDSTSEDIQELAHRWMAHQVGRRLYEKVSPGLQATIKQVVSEIFKRRKDANRFFHNRQGGLYRHPYSRSRHLPWEVDRKRLVEMDWMGLFAQWQEQVSAEMARSGDLRLLRDIADIEQYRMSWSLQALPDEMPVESVLIDDCFELLDPPVLLRAQFSVEQVSRRDVLRLFNLYHSRLRGLIPALIRPGFILRTKFALIDSKKGFHYVAKPRGWKPPERYFHSSASISQALKQSWIVGNDDGEIDLSSTLSNIGGPLDDVQVAYLQQAPHDWYWSAKIRKGGSEIVGLPFPGNRDKALKTVARKHHAFRLVGPPSLKGWFEQVLTGNQASLGEPNLIVDQEYVQTGRVLDGDIEIEVQPVKCAASLAVSITREKGGQAEEALPFDNIVAIDLGERRVGYAVFSLHDWLNSKTAKPILDADGSPVVSSIAVASIRRLIGAVRRYRKKSQPRQKFQVQYSTALQQMRENAIGDVCQRIDALCAKYNAFPVLEKGLGSLQMGGKQLQVVYGSVVRRYTYSQVDAHKKQRTHYWFGADRWEHPYLRAYEKNESGEFTKKLKPVSMFPGCQVRAAQTSQICHVCERSVLVELRKLSSSVDVRDGGLLDVENGTVRLCRTRNLSRSEIRALRRQKERTPFDLPIEAGKYANKKIITIARRNLRRPNHSTQSNDTSQSQYHCLYVDCDWSGHADENAAINIGKRFLLERLDHSTSLAAFQELNKQ